MGSVHICFSIVFFPLICKAFAVDTLQFFTVVIIAAVCVFAWKLAFKYSVERAAHLFALSFPQNSETEKEAARARTRSQTRYVKSVYTNNE